MEETTPFVGQGNDSTCAAVAIFNACLHLGIEPPPLASLVGELRCDGGRAIGVDGVVRRVLGGAAEYCEDADRLFCSGGLLTILHPIFNLHMCLCLREGVDRYTLVNSWLGPTTCRGLGRAEVERFMPSHPNKVEGGTGMWAFSRWFPANAGGLRCEVLHAVPMACPATIVRTG